MDNFLHSRVTECKKNLLLNTLISCNFDQNWYVKGDPKKVRLFNYGDISGTIRSIKLEKKQIITYSIYYGMMT